MPAFPCDLIHPSATVPVALRDVIAEAAIDAASHAGAAMAHHQALDRGAPDWISQRVDELAQQHLDTGDHHGHAAEVRLDVVKWLTGTSGQVHAAEEDSVLTSLPALTLVPDLPLE